MSKTTLHRSGPTGTKLNLAILGDGYAAEDQDEFNEWVDENILNRVFGYSYFDEDIQAFNIFRINLTSAESGVSQAKYDKDGDRISFTPKDTALDVVFNGQWDQAWMKNGPKTSRRVAAALRTWVPDYTFALIVLNERRHGGKASGNKLYVTSGSNWKVISHEFGHGFGSLADEYCKKGTWGGGSTKRVNVTSESDPDKVPWKAFIAPGTPVPTGVNADAGNGRCTMYNAGDKPTDWDPSQDVGLFEGGLYKDKGVFRPVENCMMRSNRNPFCPVCFAAMKKKHHTKTGHTFRHPVVGNFSGTGFDDLVLHDDNGIRHFTAGQTGYEFSSAAVPKVPGTWQFASGDQFLAADVRGNGRDQLLVFNLTDWGRGYIGLLELDDDNRFRLTRRHDTRIGGWEFKKGDRFTVGDFTGDGRADLLVSNHEDWPDPAVGLLRWTGTRFEQVFRFTRRFAGWQMRKGDVFLPGNFHDGAPRDLVVHNTAAWSKPYLALLRSSGSRFSMSRRYDGQIDGWKMGKHDRYLVGDFDGDGIDDLYVANGEDWRHANLGMLRTDGGRLDEVRRYEGALPGWQMRPNDHYVAADTTGDGRTDLVAYNHADWSTEYLGVLTSRGTALRGRWVKDRMGEWNLGASDRLVVCRHSDESRDDLLIHNDEWLGTVETSSRPNLHTIYHRWIRNERHGNHWS